MSSPSARSSRSTPASSAAVSRTRAWFDGSCSGTLSRAGVVRYGPWTRKPRKVSFSVGKKTVSGDGAVPAMRLWPRTVAGPEGDLDPEAGSRPAAGPVS